ncbi:Glutamine-dependent NAD(+) synthetase [Meloidogyne graminicola]|uniref:Glutamine-dependent NAD(+) synthetase n=1 Tax=Meloidogyne graminicola TaxID=189291 RepID=A0A8T0A203_9BILA|nr:Glutamine-dependent NAD(+) synthetase [Meloidogyne graminicola]
MFHNIAPTCLPSIPTSNDKKEQQNKIESAIISSINEIINTKNSSLNQKMVLTMENSDILGLVKSLDRFFAYGLIKMDKCYWSFVRELIPGEERIDLKQRWNCTNRRELSIAWLKDSLTRRNLQFQMFGFIACSDSLKRIYYERNSCLRNLILLKRVCLLLDELAEFEFNIEPSYVLRIEDTPIALPAISSPIDGTMSPVQSSISNSPIASNAFNGNLAINIYRKRRESAARLSTNGSFCEIARNSYLEGLVDDLPEVDITALTAGETSVQSAKEQREHEILFLSLIYWQQNLNKSILNSSSLECYMYIREIYQKSWNRKSISQWQQSYLVLRGSMFYQFSDSSFKFAQRSLNLRDSMEEVCRIDLANDEKYTFQITFSIDIAGGDGLYALQIGCPNEEIMKRWISSLSMALNVTSDNPPPVACMAILTSTHLVFAQEGVNCAVDGFMRGLCSISREECSKAEMFIMLSTCKTKTGRIINLAVCTVNQWSLDFTGNKERILKTCQEAFEKGSKVRLGPELEICGYNCLDHFHELDTEIHSWEVLKEIVDESIKVMPNLLIITGMPIRYRLGLYNCMVSLVNGHIVFIYPKTVLANDDIYREGRWFVSWVHKNKIVDFKLNPDYGFLQETVPFGNGFIESTDGVKIGFEMCEEMWTARSPSNDLALQGVDIICNSSGSHHVLGKSYKRIKQLVLGITSKLGGVYMYSNHRGMDGERVYFDGMSSIAQNTDLYAHIPQFDLEDTCTKNCLLNLDRSTVYRGNIASTCQESSRSDDMPIVHFKATLLSLDSFDQLLSFPIEIKPLTNVEELCHAPPAWLWHYLRRSKQSGFFLPLSGGQDSSSVALMVRLMCEKICEAVKLNPDSNDPAYFLEGKKSQDKREGMALQNLQARTRMILAYLHAQTSLISQGRTGNLLVLGASNVDESLVGYVTKYDCSSADLNPIGAISKHDLRKFLQYVNSTHKFVYLQGIINSIPTAELKPLKNGQIIQTDEEDIGLTYNELSEFGKLRKPECLGPVGMFKNLLNNWKGTSYEQIAQKVELFFRRYTINRHKATIATPGYRDDSIKQVHKTKDELSLPLKIASYKQLYGWTMDEIVKKIGKKNNCTFCGVFRRQALDRVALNVGVLKLATGHNVDDGAETVLMNILRGDFGRLKRFGEFNNNNNNDDEESLPRVKPLKYSFEKKSKWLTKLETEGTKTSKNEMEINSIINNNNNTCGSTNNCDCGNNFNDF